MKIGPTSKLTIDVDNYLFYKGFKAALKDLLTEIQNASCEILLIHGVPQIGKSCLAQCLSYYLACEGESAAYVKMDGKANIDNEVAVGSLCAYFSMTKWIIFDQCNLDCLLNQEARFMGKVSGRKISGKRIPLIMFTSGHYAPQSYWMNHRQVKFKVISLHVDEALVDYLKERDSISKEAVDNKDILNMLKVSTICGHVEQCLDKCNTIQPEEINAERLEDVIYQKLDMATLGHKLELFWLLWPQFPHASIDEVKSNLEPEYWRIEPFTIQYLSFILSGIQNPCDTGLNIINWLCISGERAVQGKTGEGYCTYQDNSYFYHFPHLEKLHAIMIGSHKKCTLLKLFAAYKDVFVKLQTIQESNAQALRGLLFENMVRVACEMSNTQNSKKSLFILSGVLLQLLQLMKCVRLVTKISCVGR